MLPPSLSNRVFSWQSWEILSPETPGTFVPSSRDALDIYRSFRRQQEHRLDVFDLRHDPFGSRRATHTWHHSFFIVHVLETCTTVNFPEKWSWLTLTHLVRLFFPLWKRSLSPVTSSLVTLSSTSVATLAFSARNTWSHEVVESSVPEAPDWRCPSGHRLTSESPGERGTLAERGQWTDRLGPTVY